MTLEEILQDLLKKLDQSSNSLDDLSNDVSDLKDDLYNTKAQLDVLQSDHDRMLTTLRCL